MTAVTLEQHPFPHHHTTHTPKQTGVGVPVEGYQDVVNLNSQQHYSTTTDSDPHHHQHHPEIRGVHGCCGVVGREPPSGRKHAIVQLTLIEHTFMSVV